MHFTLQTRELDDQSKVAARPLPFPDLARIPSSNLPTVDISLSQVWRNFSCVFKFFWAVLLLSFGVVVVELLPYHQVVSLTMALQSLGYDHYLQETSLMAFAPPANFAATAAI